MPAWRMADSREGKCLESLLDKIILKVSCSRFNSDEKEYLSIRVTDFNRKPNNSKREIGWNKNPRADIKRHSFLRDADQEGRPVVELPCRTASRTTQRLPSEHPGNTVPNPCDSMHKSQNYNSPWSPVYPQQRPNLRLTISPIVFVHRRLKVMGCLSGLEMAGREWYALFTFSRFSLCGAHIVAHRGDTCLKDQVTCALPWILNYRNLADVLNLIVPKSFSVNVK